MVEHSPEGDLDQLLADIQSSERDMAQKFEGRCRRIRATLAYEWALTKRMGKSRE